MADRNDQDPNGYMAETMPANNPQPEVTEDDREAVAAFHKQSLKALLETTDAEIDAGINRSHALLCQAFARHRIAAERRVLEEAARVASIPGDMARIDGEIRKCSYAIAAAIRAMKEEPKV